MGEVSSVPGRLPNSSTRPAPSRRRPRLWALLSILVLCLAALSMGCGLIGGDGEPEEASEPGDELRAQVQAELAAEDGDKPALEKDAAVEGASEETKADVPAESEAEPPPKAEPETNAGPALVLENGEQARDLAWAYISQCITFASSELGATQIAGNWYVKGNGAATRDYGFWEIDAATGKVAPHDSQSRRWESAVAAGCSPDSVQAIATRTQIIPDAAGASASVWSFLVQCVPTLLRESFEATFDPAQGKWVVVTKLESSDQFGTWMVDAESGTLDAYTQLSRQWESVIGLGCTADLVKPLLKPTPVVVEITAAVTNLWSYLVKCAPGLTIEDLQATWNPVKSEWIVITSPDTDTDYGVWTVRRDGTISPDNLEANRRDLLSTAGTC